jgi:hypothetical protein
MTAIAVTAPATKHKLYYTMMGPKNNPGATIKVIKIVPPDSYTSTGDALDLTTLFPRRIYCVMFMNSNARSGTSFAQVGYAPGTAKTDYRGGYSPADGKIVFSAGATESSGDMSAYVVYAVVSGC